MVKDNIKILKNINLKEGDIYMWDIINFILTVIVIGILTKLERVLYKRRDKE